MSFQYWQMNFQASRCLLRRSEKKKKVSRCFLCLLTHLMLFVLTADQSQDNEILTLSLSGKLWVFQTSQEEIFVFNVRMVTVNQAERCYTSCDSSLYMKRRQDRQGAIADDPDTQYPVMFYRQSLLPDAVQRPTGINCSQQTRVQQLVLSG